MNSRRSNCIFTLSSFALLLLAACAAPPKEVTPSQSSEPSQNTASTSSTPSSPGIAVGHDTDTSAPAAPAAPPTAPSRPSSGSGEVKWSVPAGWKTGPEKPMRSATYLIPAAQGDSDGGECAVFMNIGGGVEANITRWIGQFEQPDGSPSGSKARQKKETINGFSVTTVDLTGTFAGGGMAMGQPTTKKTGYRLLGAIVETPQGEIFFKLTGPKKTLAAAQADFQSLLKSIKM